MLMKSTKPDQLYCSVFGHNYFKIHRQKSKQPILVCRTCNSKAAIDSTGDVVELQSSNKDFNAVLRQLYWLKRRRAEGLELIHNTFTKEL